MPSASIEPNAYIYSATISACGRGTARLCASLTETRDEKFLPGSQWPLALHLSASTRKSVSLASFNATISSIAKASLGISLEKLRSATILY